jgi:hypothetical protein
MRDQESGGVNSLPKLWLGRVSVAAIVMGLTLGASMTVAAAAPAAHLLPRTNICGFLDDGGGAGSANSLKPGVTPTGGLDFLQENTGAWQMCLTPLGNLTLFANQGQWCESSNNNQAKLRGCNLNNDQGWFLTSFNGGFQVNNLNGGVLCASGGVGSQDTVTASSNCSNYHQTWQFEASP